MPVPTAPEWNHPTTNAAHKNKNKNKKRDERKIESSLKQLKDLLTSFYIYSPTENLDIFWVQVTEVINHP